VTFSSLAKRPPAKSDFCFQGGLCVSRSGDGWYEHGASKGGYAVALICHLKGCDTRDAIAYAVAFLKANPGNGTANAESGDDEDETRRAFNATVAADILAKAVPIIGTPAEVYLRQTRKITGSRPDDLLHFLPDTRPGECALIAVLSAADAIAGVQITYLNLTPVGHKSLIKPQRRIYLLDTVHARSAAFRVTVDDDANRPFVHSGTVIVEGTEHALSIAQSHIAPRVVATMGVGGIGRYVPTEDESILIVRDGDLPGSKVAGTLVTAVDSLTLAGAVVRVSDMLDNFDANKILQQAGGEDALRCLCVDGAAKAPQELSFVGDCRRLATLNDVAYEEERLAVAKKHRVRIGKLDEAVDKLRAKRHPCETEGARVRDKYDAPVWEGGQIVLSKVSIPHTAMRWSCGSFTPVCASTLLSS
jgi:hypothetical protein